MEVSLDEIKENYSRFSDSKLKMLITYESESLRPEALEILKDELLKRNISLDNLKIDTQGRTDIKSKPIERKFYLNQNTRFLYIFVYGILSYALISLFYGELLNGKIIKKLISLAIILLGIFSGYSSIRQLFNRTVLLETQSKNMVVSLDNRGTRKWNVFLYSMKVLSNSLQKIVIPYDQIVSVYKDKNLLEGTSIKISYKDEQGQILECKTALTLLDELTDLPEFKSVLKMKKVMGVEI